SLCTLSLSFFFSRYRYHLDLHSFPTRRSSDLTDEDGRPPAEGSAVLVGYADQIGNHRDRQRHRERADQVHVGVIRNRIQQLVDRSEEHTSELQSRSDLVCRLLLEKKKKIRLRR